MFVEIVDDVRAYFQARGITADVLEGTAARNTQPEITTNDGRVVFAPSKSAISIEPPQFLGEGDNGAPRQLWLTMFFFEVAFAGYDPDNPERDLCHRRRCYDLWEAAAQAIHKAYYGSYQWLSAQWSDERKVGRYGAELVVELAVAVPLFDLADKPAKPKPVLKEPKQLLPDD